MKHKDPMKSSLMAPKCRGGRHQPPFPEWWDNQPPTAEKTARQQHRPCCWGCSHQSCTELLPVYESTSSRCSSLIWCNVLLAGDSEWRHGEPIYLPYEHPLVIEWLRHTCSFLLDTKPLWHWGKWKSGPASKRYLWPWHRPPLTCIQFADFKPLVNSYIQRSVQIKWDVAVHDKRSLSLETKTRAAEEIPAHSWSWRGRNHPTSNWPYQGHQGPYLVPRTADYLSRLWSNADHWPSASGVYRKVIMNTTLLTHWILSTVPGTCIIEFMLSDLNDRPSIKLLSWINPEMMQLYYLPIAPRRVI